MTKYASVSGTLGPITGCGHSHVLVCVCVWFYGLCLQCPKCLMAHVKVLKNVHVWFHMCANVRVVFEKRDSCLLLPQGVIKEEGEPVIWGLL